ncbi:hypothetical protein C5167_020234 [Papaver somniferum]|uniref:Fatty acid hydroxylase domain-containing protein n=1 Tax=Papaver somniferum TaxID=3469 RepID=A0A4Y7IWC5_PAPSO|nr:hypothetical protein C5167_020234 [Papaver somniferum]
MASKPGILTEWPWTPLGRFKYIVLAPWVLDSISPLFFSGNNSSKWDLSYFLILPLCLWRMIHNQIRISFSRFKTSKSKNRIVGKPIEFEQVDRKSNWDDHIILSGILLYLVHSYMPGSSQLSIWRTDGIVMTALLHAGPVEFLYYWFHRALHHHFLYSRYHSHHHSSIVSEPSTSWTHPFWEWIGYYLLFAIPALSMIFTGTASIVSFGGYFTYVDFMNNMGHCNFEFIPTTFFTTFPLLKYIFYTPTYHALHHTQFRKNYSLFVPVCDYIYGTIHTSTDLVYETSLKRTEESPDVVHLTHPTTPDSIYHLRLGFASLASVPAYHNGTTNTTVMFGYTFVLERNIFDDNVTKKVLKMQTWAIPRYSYHYKKEKQKGGINRLIEEAILDADKAGVKVEELNDNDKVYIQRHPNLKIRVVDGSSLATALVLNTINNIPAAVYCKTEDNKTDQKLSLTVMIRGKLTKVACSIALALCQRGVQVVVSQQSSNNEFENLRSRLFGSLAPSCVNEHNNNNIHHNLIPSADYTSAHRGSILVWLVDDEFSEEDHINAPKGTIFIPYSQFPPWSNFKKMLTIQDAASNAFRKDCIYHSTPAMLIPPSLQNVHSCENWLPRRVMSAWRVAGILHALENWGDHECGKWLKNNQNVDVIEKVWSASLRHGFRPYYVHTPACNRTRTAA